MNLLLGWHTDGSNQSQNKVANRIKNPCRWIMSTSPNKSPFSSQLEAVPASDLACVVWARLSERAASGAVAAPTRTAHPRLRWAARKQDGDYQRGRGGSRSRISST